MSHVDSKYSKTYVTTYKELVFIFLVFVVILIILYPKDLLKEKILAEETNYDLSMLYLKNLIQQDPNNESLMLILAEQSLKSGNKHLSLRLLELLLRSENENHLKRATTISYDLKKDDYYYFKEEKEQLEQKEKLRELFLSIMEKKMYEEEDTDKWYQESVFLEEYKYMYIFIDKKLALEPDNISLLKQAYYIAIKLKYKKESLKHASRLAELDTVDKDKWLMDKYYILMENHLYARAEKLLKENGKKSEEWKGKSADFYFLRKSFIRASENYMELSNKADTYAKKKDYFLKAINALQAGNHFKVAGALAFKHQKTFIHDREMRKYFLKLYVSIGDLEKASYLSNKILEKEIR